MKIILSDVEKEQFVQAMTDQLVRPMVDQFFNGTETVTGYEGYETTEDDILMEEEPTEIDTSQLPPWMRVDHTLKQSYDYLNSLSEKELTHFLEVNKRLDSSMKANHERTMEKLLEGAFDNTKIRTLSEAMFNSFTDTNEHAVKEEPADDTKIYHFEVPSSSIAYSFDSDYWSFDPENFTVTLR